MPTHLEHMRNILMPGLYSVRGSYSEIPVLWDAVFAADRAVAATPVMSIPVSLSAAVAVGVAAAIIKNPTVTRRFFSWFKPETIDVASL